MYHLMAALLKKIQKSLSYLAACHKYKILAHRHFAKYTQNAGARLAPGNSSTGALRLFSPVRTFCQAPALRILAIESSDIEARPRTRIGRGKHREFS